MAALILAVLLSIAAPAILLDVLLSPLRGSSARLLCVSLAVGLGLGAASLLFFVWLALFGSTRSAGYLALEIVGFLTLAGVGMVLQRRRCPVRNRAALAAWRPRAWLGWGCLASLVCAGIGFVLYCTQSPHGDLDAWAIWNNRARFLFRGQEVWRQLFTNQIAWSHPDYPLLVPSSVARLWSYVGNETVIAPCLLAGLFTFAVAGVLVAALTLLRSPSQGYLAGILLFSSPFYIELATAQYADVPMSWFFLATLALWCLEGAAEDRSSLFLPALTGLTAGLGAWTKNEGELFFLAVLLVRLGSDLLASGRAARLRRSGMFLVGAIPALLVLGYFKFFIAPSNDLLATVRQGPAIHSRLFHTGRTWIIVRETAAALWRTEWVALVALIVCGACLGPRPDQSWADGARVGAALALVTLGYFATYLLASWDNLENHLRFSVDRLLMQLFPSVLFLFGLCSATPEEVWARGQGSARHASGNIPQVIQEPKPG